VGCLLLYGNSRFVKKKEGKAIPVTSRFVLGQKRTQSA
jgi:hypothetical protein